MGIGRLKCPVVDVNDLALAEAFYSELTGIPVISSVWTRSRSTWLVTSFAGFGREAR